MDLETMRAILSEEDTQYARWLAEAKVAERYFRCDNDILHPEFIPKPWLTQKGAGLREANNRIACTYYNFLVNQKATYTVGNPPRYDADSETANEAIEGVLGGHWRKTCKHLCVNASNTGVGWLHSWIGDDGKFRYGVVDSKQIKAVWGGTLAQELLAVRRNYSQRDPDDGLVWEVTEYWDREKCYAYRAPSGGGLGLLEEYPRFWRLDDATGEEIATNEYEHGFEEVPFTAFFNNQFHINDLRPIKGYIDAYDKVFSLFTDNLEDVQQVIFVLENMGGTNLQEFKRQLREEKAVKVINDDEMKTDLRVLSVEIPTNAAEVLLDKARKNIFEQGQGVDPTPENYSGNTSGEALKYMYANLEQKSASLKDEFEIGFRRFAGLFCPTIGIDPENVDFYWGDPVRINNITEQITNAVNSSQILSERTLLANHPWVDDPDEEMEQKRSEEKEKLETYPNPLTNAATASDEEEEDEDGNV